MIPRGKKITLFFILLFFIFSAFSLYFFSFLFLILTIYSAWFFRDPERIPPAEPGYLSPADGKVIKVSELDDPFVGRAKCLSIFMSPFDVHVNRSPCRGEIKELKYKKGSFRIASTDEAQLRNERNEVMMVDDAGRKIKFVQIAGAMARRIFFFKNPGDRLERGERVGFISFGSRVDLILPEDVEVLVSPGMRVRAGETIIGR